MNVVSRNVVAKQYHASEKTVERALANLGIKPTVELQSGKRTYRAYDADVLGLRDSDISAEIASIRAAGVAGRAKWFEKGHAPLVTRVKREPAAVAELGPKAVSALGEIQVIRKRLNKLVTMIGG